MSSSYSSVIHYKDVWYCIKGVLLFILALGPMMVWLLLGCPNSTKFIPIAITYEIIIVLIYWIAIDRWLDNKWGKRFAFRYNWKTCEKEYIGK